MPISRDNHGFLYWPDAWGSPALGLETGYLQRCIDELRARGLKGAFGRHPEFQEADLSCLRSLPHLTSVQLWDITLSDISAIYELANLSHFRISGKRPPIDFGRMSSVKDLVVEHHRKDVGLSELRNLKAMDLWRFKAPCKESFEFQLPGNVEKLGIFWSNVESLGRVDELTHVTV